MLCAPPRAAALEPPEVSAACAILVDAGSGRVLYQKNEDEERLIASITKLMTALVASESMEDYDATVVIEPEWTGAEGSSLYLKAGEELSLRTLLYGLLLESGNDAAVAVACYCAGDVDTFVDWMNQRAASLGMANTHFVNPNGLNDDNHYSTAADMAKLALACLEDDLVSEIVATRSITIGSRTFTNHNKLLWRYEGCVGMKTGYTQLAGRTLVSAATRGHQTLVAVTLKAPNDWADHAALFDHGFEEWPAITLCTAGRVFRRVPVDGSLTRFVAVRTMDDLSYPLSLTEQVTARVDLPRSVDAPVSEGAVAGRIVFSLGGVPVGESYLVYDASVRRDEIASRGLVGRIMSLFRGGAGCLAAFVPLNGATIQ